MGFVILASFFLGDGPKRLKSDPAILQANALPLVIDGLVKRFGDKVALDNVSLEIVPGEIFALLGPNGAGKSTLIHCVSGLARPTAGELRVFGYDTQREFRQSRRLLGLVPQELSFDPFFTPFESLYLQMGLMGVQPDARWCEELLELFALSDKRDAYTRTLSGGMKRRLLVAKALVHKPKLLFLDEPTAGVDVELRQDLWRTVKHLRDEGTTIVLTTHYLEEAEKLADRIGVIHRGRIILTEARDALMTRFQQNHVIATLSPATAMSAALPDLPANSALRAGELVVPWLLPEELERVIGTLRRHGELKRFRVTHTDLEEIFIELIRAAEEEPS